MQAGDCDEVFAPVSVVSKWLVSDEEALDPKVDWYEDPDDESDEESEAEEGGSGAPAPPRQRQPREGAR